MKPTLATIVTGESEVAALPVLVRRIALALDPPMHVDVPLPIRAQESRLGKEGELERFLILAGNKFPGAPVLLLIDCDDGCPATLGPALSARAAKARPDLTIEVALAKREFESWLVASAESLRGQRGFPDSISAPTDAEAIRDAKGWLGHRRVPPGYRATTDLPALTARFDLALARQRSDSFAATERRILRLLEVLRRRGP